MSQNSQKLSQISQKSQKKVAKDFKNSLISERKKNPKKCKKSEV